MSRKQICKILYVLTVVVFISVNTLSVFAVVNHVYSCIACVAQETVDCAEFAKLTENSRQFCLIYYSNVSTYVKICSNSDILTYTYESHSNTPVTCKVKMNN